MGILVCEKTRDAIFNELIRMERKRSCLIHVALLCDKLFLSSEVFDMFDDLQWSVNHCDEVEVNEGWEKTAVLRRKVLARHK